MDALQINDPPRATFALSVGSLKAAELQSVKGSAIFSYVAADPRREILAIVAPGRAAVSLRACPLDHDCPVRSFDEAKARSQKALDERCRRQRMLTQFYR